MSLLFILSFKQNGNRLKSSHKAYWESPPPMSPGKSTSMCTCCQACSKSNTIFIYLSGGNPILFIIKKIKRLVNTKYYFYGMLSIWYACIFIIYYNNSCVKGDVYFYILYIYIC